MKRTLPALASLAMLAMAWSAPASAWSTSAEYCNNYAADVAAGRPGAPYDVAAEGVFMAAYRDCMRAYQIMLPIRLLPPRSEVEIVAGADIEASRVPWQRENWGRPVAADQHAYCAARYRSYNPDTGMFLSYSGVWKPCR